MKTTARFEAAIQNLYTAFYNNTLNPECCTQCAVGSILGGSNAWQHLSDHHGSFQLNYVGKVHEMMGRRFQGYLPSELLQIENAFLQGCGYQLPLHHSHFKPSNPTDKELLFDGLCATLTVLCKLDNITNTTTISTVFSNKVKEPFPDLCKV
ncbi:MAG: Na(+)-translocating NADH-quinone reductase subunit F [Flavobacteriaceae bacterium]|nr:Na(+)-translocating NADH-quinone reductase subunit F [Flavobacteriaceae bacterium]